MTTVLVLTHTDIRSDSRILKEMEALATAPLGLRVVGYGVEVEDGAVRSAPPEGVELTNVPLWSAHLAGLPRPLRYALVMVELVIRLTLLGRRTGAAVVHCHDTMVLPAGLILKVLLHATLVYDAHELESDKNGSSRALQLATIAVESLAWPHVDLFISVSPAIVDWYHRRFGARRSIVVLNSPRIASAAGDAGDSRDLRSRFAIPAHSIVFLYVGILGPGRGLHQLMSSFADATGSSHLVVVGYGELRDEILAASRKNPRIHLHDPVPHAEVVALVRSADVGLCIIENVSLSDYLCLPNKLFEYAFAGVPVLASDFPELKRVVEQYRLGLCTAVEPEAIREAIRRCEASPLPRITTSVADLSWDAQEAVLTSAYRELLSGRRS